MASGNERQLYAAGESREQASSIEQNTLEICCDFACAARLYLCPCLCCSCACLIPCIEQETAVSQHFAHLPRLDAHLILPVRLNRW